MYADQAQVIIKKLQAELPSKFVVLGGQIKGEEGNIAILGGVPNGQPGELKFVKGTGFVIICDNNSEDWIVMFDDQSENYDNMYAATDAVLKRMKTSDLISIVEYSVEE